MSSEPFHLLFPVCQAIVGCARLVLGHQHDGRRKERGDSASQPQTWTGLLWLRVALVSTQSHSEGVWEMDSSVPPHAHSNAVAGGGELAVCIMASRGWATTVHTAWREAPTALLWDTVGTLRRWTSRAGASGGSRAELPEGLRAEKPTQGCPETPKPAHRNLSPRGEVNLQSEVWGTSRQNGGQSSPSTGSRQLLGCGCK